MDLESRRREVEQCLDEFGLGRQPRRRSGGGEEPVRRLRRALEALGPVFSSFGLYLSSRVDLLPAEDCLELATLPDRAEPTPFAAIRDVLSRELGRAPEEVYQDLEATPFESRLLCQSHRARLYSKEAVTVKVVHPGREEEFESDIELLALLGAGLEAGEWADLPLGAALGDFQRTLRQQLDLEREAGAMEALAHDAKAFDRLAAPAVYRNLCSARVLTAESLPGWRLDDIIRSLADRPLLGEVGVEPHDLARNLCYAWLRQALQGRLFAVEPRAENVVVLPGGQIAFNGGFFASLPAEAQENLQDYLIAASARDPDRGCACLLREMESDGQPASEQKLRQRLRQAVPFRDGGWSRAGDSNSLAEHLFVHWRLASQHGYRPRPHVLGFYRGLFLVAAVARRLAPDRDPLLQGLEDLRLMAGLAQFRELMNLPRSAASLNQYMALVVELPKKLDEVLRLAASGGLRVKLQAAETSARRRQKNASAAVVALLLLLAAVALLSYHFAAVGGAWIERAGAVAFVGLGALLLRAIARMR